MCGKIQNVARQFRSTALQFPNGKTASLEEIDTRFKDVSHDVRGDLSRRVLSAIPRAHHHVIIDLAERTTKARPVPRDHIELVTFCAIGVATPDGADVRATVDQVVAARSCEPLGFQRAGAR